MAKFIGLSKITSGISNVVDKVKDHLNSEDEQPQDNVPTVVDSMAEMEQLICQLRTGAPVNVGMVLQQELSVLKFIESPSMSGMIVDNIIVCLHKALDSAETEEEKQQLRDSITSMLQSVLFVSEARLQYAIRKDKEEAVEMMANAGNLLADSVSGLAYMMLPGGQAKAVPMVKNILDPAVLGSSMTNFLTARKKQEMLEEKIKDHNEMLENLFKTFDRYFPIIGPSIQIHGMLSRYVKQLERSYREAQYKEVESYTTRLAEQKESLVSNAASSVHKNLGNSLYERVAKGVLDVVGSLANALKKPDTLTYEEVKQLHIIQKNKVETVREKIALIHTVLSDKKAQLESAGLFQASLKSRLASEIKATEKELTALNQELIDAEEKLRIVQDMIIPAEERVAAYVSDLCRIAEKYAISL